MKIYSKQALKDAQAMAKVAIDEFDMACANVLLRIAYGYQKLESEASFSLARKYYGADS